MESNAIGILDVDWSPKTVSPNHHLYQSRWAAANGWVLTTDGSIMVRAFNHLNEIANRFL